MKLKDLKPIAMIAHGGFWIPLLISGVHFETMLMLTGAFWMMYFSLVLLLSPFMPDEEKAKNDQAACSAAGGICVRGCSGLSGCRARAESEAR